MTEEEGKRALTVSRPELLVDGKDTVFRDLLHIIFAFGSRLEDLRAGFGSFIELSPTQYMILLTVSQLEEAEAGISEVADHLYLSGALVTIEVNRMVKADMLAKAPNSSDRRRVVLALTERGRGALTRLAELQRPVNDALFKDISRDDFQRLHRSLRKLLSNIETAKSLLDYLQKAP